VCLSYFTGSELHKFGALKLFISLMTEMTESAASHYLLALANMASYGGLTSDVIQLNAVQSLIAVLNKAQ